MAYALFWTALLGAGLGLDRSMRHLRVGWAACALWAATGYVLAWDMRAGGVADSPAAWPIAAAACAVAVGYYLATTTALDGASRPNEPWAAAAAACAFGLAYGFQGYLLLAGMTLASIFLLAWRPLDAPAPAVATKRAPSTPGLCPTANVVDIRRRPEEGRNDNESSQQGEEQGQGEQLAHAGCPGVAGQA